MFPYRAGLRTPREQSDDRRHLPILLPKRPSFLVAYLSQIAPYLAGGRGIQTCRPAVSLLLFSVVQLNEFQDRLLYPLDGIADAAPDPAGIKWILVSRTGR